MQKLKLTNNNKVQVVSLKLDKTKPREFAFRMFLDQNETNGINRKETILRMFEQIIKQSDNIFANNYGHIKNDEDDSNSNANNDISTISISDTDANIDDWNVV